MGAAKDSMMARKHWATRLPKKTADLQADTDLGATLRTVGKTVQE